MLEARTKRTDMDTKIDVPEPLASIMYACEVNCIAGCCGLDAFDIHPQWIRAWMESHDPALLAVARQQLDELIEYLSEVEGNYYSPLLNVDGSNTGWISLLAQWKVAIEQAPAAPLPQPPKQKPPATAFTSWMTEKLLLLSCGALGAALIVAIIALIYWLLGRW